MVTGTKPGGRRATDRVGRSGGVALILLAVCVTLVLTCRKWDNPLDPTGNRPPAVPKYPSPADSSIRSNAGLVLSWHSYDPDSGDTAYFDIFMGAASPPGLVQSGWSDTTFQPTDVAGSTRYFWQIRAYDNHGDDTTGPIWQFTTVAPILVTAPDTGEQLRIDSQDTITWTGGPPGGDDSTLVYWSANDGASWTRLGRATTPGQLAWQVPAPATESARVRVWVYLSADTMIGASGRFAIEDTLPLSGAAATAPDSGSVPANGSVHDLACSGITRGADSDNDGTVSFLSVGTKRSR